ncbi:MAG: tetratricopeptide repeat protein, partial [Myxococcota bacterium]|nr:tetratricopeptide repeat protein [Myxococcota bacterium]
MSARSVFRACACALLMLVGISLLPAAASARGLDEVMRDAVQARDAGDLDRTVTLLWEAYKIQPAPEILNNLGKILEQLGRYREAYDAYKKVTDDPEADQSLRALDSSRIATLQPKLNKAWLLPKITPKDATVLVDGEPTGMPPGVEFGVSHGLHALQVEHPDIEDIVMRFGAFPMDRRMDFIVDLRKLGGHLGRLDLGSRPRPKEIRINGKALAGDLDRPGSVCLVPGTYDVVVVGAFEATGRSKITVESGG